MAQAYSVHSADDAPSRSKRVKGDSFQDAALTFLEDNHPAGDDVALMVEDCETGERQCFRIDLLTGEAGPCG